MIMQQRFITNMMLVAAFSTAPDEGGKPAAATRNPCRRLGASPKRMLAMC
jgi:hypothetical protein